LVFRNRREGLFTRLFGCLEHVMTCISDSENYLIRLVPFSWITRNGGSSRSTTSCHKAVLAKQKGIAKSSFKVRWDFADLKTSSLGPVKAVI
jgi:hypothetical protein